MKIVFAFLLAMGSTAHGKPSLGAPEFNAALVIDTRNDGEIHLFPREKRGEFAIESGPFLEKLAPHVTQSVIDALVAKVHDEVISLEDLDGVLLVANYDEVRRELRLEIPLALREASPVVVAEPESAPVLKSDRPSGYFNLRTNASSLTGDGVTENRLPLVGRAELVHSMKGWTFESSADYLEHRASSWRRLDTRLIHDDEESLQRWSLGDVTSSSRGFMQAQAVGGLSLRKENSIRPERTAVRLSDTDVLLKRDSTVDVIVNGTSFTQIRLPAGRFSLRDFPILSGLNKVTLKVKDDLGAVEVFDVDLLFESSLLERGEHEFDDSLGSPWTESGGDRAYQTSGILSTISHRYGVSDTLTLGLQFQNYFYHVLGGIEASKMTNGGLFSFDGAGCDVIGVRGFAGRLRWRSPDQFMGLDSSWRFAAEYGGQNDTFFPVLTTPFPLVIFESTSDVQVSKVFPGRIVASLGETLETGFGEAPSRRTDRANLVMPLTKSIRLDATYQRVHFTTDEDRGLVTLTWTDSPGHFSVSAFHESQTHASGVQLQRSNERAFDDWRVNVAGKSMEDSQSASLDLEGLFQPAEVRLTHFSSRIAGARSDLTSIGLDSGVVWVGDTFAVSAPVADAFALAKIPSTTTFRNLTSYAETPVSVNGSSFRVKPGYRGGVLIQPEFRSALLVRGFLQSAKGQPMSLVTGEIAKEDGTVVNDSFFTNRDGAFVIENLEPGDYVLRVNGGSLKFAVPKDAGAILDLGRQTLTGDQK